MMKKILVIGAFGYQNNQLDGQTVKTRNIVKMLNEHKDIVTYSFDTLNVRGIKNTYLLSQLVWYLFVCDYVIMVPANNSLARLFPVIAKLSHIFRYKLIVTCVGGWQIDFFEGTYKFSEHRDLINISKSIHAFLPEMENVNKVLKEKYRFTNTEVFPNFRYIKDIKLTKNDSPSLKLVFMGRINKNKGFNTIFNLAKDIFIKKYDITIDFYGQIETEDEDEFMLNLKETASIVSYKGFLEPNVINATLMHYDVLLLPTKYYTEGFPGSILDAYISGIPVIVTEWAHSHEFVKENLTGSIVPFNDCQNDFNNAVYRIYFDRNLLKRMKKCAYAESKKYTPESAWEVISKYLR